jgi:hypothetical protein
MAGNLNARNDAQTRARDRYIANKRRWYAQKIAQVDVPGRQREGIDYAARLVEFDEQYADSPLGEKKAADQG